MSVLAKASYFWRSAAAGLRHSPFIHFIAVTTIALALFSAGLARGLSHLVDALLASLGGDVEVTVYVAPELPPPEVQALRARMETASGGRAELISPEASLERLSVELGDLGEALAHLPENPLPPSLELALPAERRNPGALQELARELRALPGVTGVDYGEEAVARLSAIAEALRYGGLIVAATLQLAIYARREEIEIQKLVGATDRFVKAPFLIEGLLQGLLGAGVALGALLTFERLVGPGLASLFSFLLGPATGTPLVNARLGLELLVAGCALGLGGSFIAVGRFSRV
jgi:cell division transport system permease protein